MAIFGSLSIVPWILFAQSSWTMDAAPVITAAAPQETRGPAEVRDRGAVFGSVAGRRADEALGRVYYRHRAPILVETVESLDGAWVADVARRRAESAGPDWLYVLVAGDERDVGVVGARHGPASRLTDRQRETIRRAFLGPLRAGQPDRALGEGVRAIGATLDAAAVEPRPDTRDILISAAMLVSTLAAVVGAHVWARGGRRRGDAGASGLDHPVVARGIASSRPGLTPANGPLRGPRWMSPPSPMRPGPPT